MCRRSGIILIWTFSPGTEKGWPGFRGTDKLHRAWLLVPVVRGGRPRRGSFTFNRCPRQNGYIRALGYSDDLVIDQPAVMDLNMRAASFGTMVLRHLLQPFLLAPLPVTCLENLVTYWVKAIEKPRALKLTCPVCQANTRAGYGDCAPHWGSTQLWCAPFRAATASE